MKSKGFCKKDFCYYRITNDSPLTYEVISFGYSSFRIKGHILLSPSVGLLFKEIEDLRRKLIGEQSNVHYVMTISSNIGYVCGKSEYYEFDCSETCPDTEIEQMIDTVITVSHEFSSGIRTYDDMLDLLKSPSIPIPRIQQNYLFPILYYLIKRPDLGLKYLENSKRSGKMLENEQYDESFVLNYTRMAKEIL